MRDPLTAAMGDAAVEEAAVASCQACRTPGLTAFYTADDVPSQTCALLTTADEARSYPTGSILLGFCRRCGFIQNVRFQPDLVDYSVPTEESQVFSPRFRRFSDRLAADLFERHHLAGKTVLEAGCGKGDFLVSLADLGLGRAVGVDPGFLPDRAPGSGTEVEFIRERLDHTHARPGYDLVIARHLLEHVPDVLDFGGLLASAVSPSGKLFVELPDVRRVLAEGAFWDIYHEHCSYFTLGSLGRLMARLGLDVTRLELAFGDQYLLASAAPPNGTVRPDIDLGEEVADLAMEVERFASSIGATIDRWRRRLETVLDAGGRVAVWGGGSKAIAFLTTVGIDDESVTVIDINPHKHGTFLPGTGQEVVDPDRLRHQPADLVIVMNPVYAEEVEASLESMDVHAELVVLQ